MIHACTELTDLDELIGTESCEGQELRFQYGPLSMAMKRDEELVLENSSVLSLIMRAKLASLVNALFIEDTSESIHAGNGFRLILR